MARYNDPHCEHGTYVGGCGADYMCGWCEDGTPWSVYQAYLNRTVRARTHGNLLAAVFTALPRNATPPWAIQIAVGLLHAPKVHA